MQRQYRREFHEDPPASLTTIWIKSKFKTNATVSTFIKNAVEDKEHQRAPPDKQGYCSVIRKYAENQEKNCVANLASVFIAI